MADSNMPGPSSKPQGGEKQAKRKNRKQNREAGAVVDSGSSVDLAPWRPLLEGSVTSLPIVFTRDAEYFFVAAASSVKVYTRETGQVVSTLSGSGGGGSSSSSGSSGGAHTDSLTGLMLNPSNATQLLTSSLDGTIKVWDYLDAALLRTIDVGHAVSHMAAHAALPQDTVVVALNKTSSGGGSQGDEAHNSIFVLVSLHAAEGKKKARRPKPWERARPRQTTRLGKTRACAGMVFSPDGSYLVAIGNRKVQIARTAALADGFVKIVSEESLTALAFHPTDLVFATGDVTGKIRLWHLLKTDEVRSSPAWWANRADRKAANTLLHWHAHAVAALAFNPSGAYLLSAGEEGVLVHWQLDTGRTDFLPRLGAPIASVAIVEGIDGREQEYAVALRDGKILLVSSVNRKVLRTFSRVLVDASRNLFDAGHLQRLTHPLAVEPGTGHLVMTAGHPSSLQFFDVDADEHVLELEVTPTNRVSRTDEVAMEPPRVERVAFSRPAPPVSSAAAAAAASLRPEWMATIDSRRAGPRFSSSGADICLRVWQWKPDASTYVLNSRIDAPHGEHPVTALAFASSSSSSSSDAGPFVVTAGQDAKVKTWRLATQKVKGHRTESFWVPRSVFGYRDAQPRDLDVSADGSLLAVAQGAFVTVWDVATNSLRLALAAPELSPARSVRFVGPQGRYLAALGQRSILLWDLVWGKLKWEKVDGPSDVGEEDNGEEKRTIVANAASQGSFSVFVNSVSAKTQQSSVVHTYRCDDAGAVASSRRLPFAVLASTPSPLAEERCYAITSHFDLVEISAAATKRQAKDEARSLRATRVARRTLFDDLFGAPTTLAEDREEQQRRREALLRQATAGATTATAKKGSYLELFDAPAHLLPPLQMLLDPFFGRILGSAAPVAAAASRAEGPALAGGEGDASMADADKGRAETEAETEAEAKAEAETKRQGGRQPTAKGHGNAMQHIEQRDDAEFLAPIFAKLAMAGSGKPGPAGEVMEQGAKRAGTVNGTTAKAPASTVASPSAKKSTKQQQQRRPSESKAEAEAAPQQPSPHSKKRKAVAE